MIRRPTVYEGTAAERLQGDHCTSTEGREPEGEHRSDLSRTDMQSDLDFERHILLALVEAQAAWIAKPDDRQLRRQLIALLAELEQ
jgi:hypothetical protein